MISSLYKCLYINGYTRYWGAKNFFSTRGSGANIMEDKKKQSDS